MFLQSPYLLNLRGLKALLTQQILSIRRQKWIITFSPFIITKVTCLTGMQCQTFEEKGQNLSNVLQKIENIQHSDRQTYAVHFMYIFYPERIFSIVIWSTYQVHLFRSLDLWFVQLTRNCQTNLSKPHTVMYLLKDTL